MRQAHNEPVPDTGADVEGSARRALCATYRKMHFPGARSPRDSRISEPGEGAQVKTDEGWTKRMKRGKTAAPQSDHHLTSVPPDDGTTLAGRECLQANLCRSLERVSTRPSTLPDVILRWPCG